MQADDLVGVEGFIAFDYVLPDWPADGYDLIDPFQYNPVDESAPFDFASVQTVHV